jgi:hypothetical protein
MRLHDAHGAPVNGLITRAKRAGQPTEVWLYDGAGEWQVHALTYWNYTTEEVGVGELLRTEHKLR